MRWQLPQGTGVDSMGQAVSGDVTPGLRSGDGITVGSQSWYGTHRGKSGPVKELAVNDLEPWLRTQPAESRGSDVPAPIGSQLCDP